MKELKYTALLPRYGYALFLCHFFNFLQVYSQVNRSESSLLISFLFIDLEPKSFPFKLYLPALTDYILFWISVGIPCNKIFHISSRISSFSKL